MTKEQKYRENKITENLWSMSSDFSKLSLMWQYTPAVEKKEENYINQETALEENFIYKAKTVYRLITTYLETLKLNEYLNDFKKEFATLFTDSPETLLESDLCEETGEEYNKIVSKIWLFLAPFEFSEKSYIDKLLKQTGVKYLEHILRNTQVIINKTGLTLKSEPQIYNTVKFVVESVFPSSLKPTSGFFKSFKNYNPDILIPEIHTAVEYKYADTEEKLKSQVDQVIADTKGYTGDTNYEIFYAVFYVTENFWGIDKFETVWKEMQFPKNWKGIYVIGKK
jgi:hypothetical protein